MKTTGIIRRFDDLGRIVIPREVRKTVFSNTDVTGVSMEIFIEGEDIILRKCKVSEADN